MDFIPTGYITIRDAIDRILRTTHGEDWGQQEIELEDEDIAVPGTDVGNGKPLYTRPYNRTVVAEAKQQVTKAEEKLLYEFQNGNLIPEIEEGPPVPLHYWETSGSNTTIKTGLLQLGEGAKPEDLKWQNRRLLLKVEKLEKWLTGTSVSDEDKKRKPRKHNADQDFKLRNKIETVLAAAKRLYPDPKKMPEKNQLARLLEVDDLVRPTEYKYETIRKILDGSYSASKRLDIPGYSGIDTQRK